MYRIVKILRPKRPELEQRARSAWVGVRTACLRLVRYNPAVFERFVCETTSDCDGVRTSHRTQLTAQGRGGRQGGGGGAQGGDVRVTGQPAANGQTVEGGVSFINPGTPVLRDAEAEQPADSHGCPTERSI